MEFIRSDKTVLGSTCTNSLNTDGTQTILFKASGTPAIPTDVSQVGIDVTLTGGQSDVFDGARGYFIFRDNSGFHLFDVPIEFKKSADGVVGFKISSVDSSKLGGTQGTPLVAIVAPDSGAPISFANIKFNVSYSFYVLQNDVSYATYPFATENKPNNTHLLAIS